MRKKYLYGEAGEISQLLPNNTAVIRFNIDGIYDYAILKKGGFYHNGKAVPEYVQLSQYIRINMKILFSCHVLHHDEYQEGDVRFSQQYKWYAVMCWVDIKNMPNNKVTITMGLVSVPTSVVSITKRRGVLTILDDKQTETRILFLASKVYLYGKRFSSMKALNSQLSIGDLLYCDAVPCIDNENSYNCEWFATCVFMGKRPYFSKFLDTSNGFQQLDVESSKESREQYLCGENIHQTVNLTSLWLNVINRHTNNSSTLFTMGYGYIFHILNDEFGILLGCFRRNLYETILFHRKNAFISKVSLATAKLSEIFEEGDRMRFVAVAAPPYFITNWLALQVAVTEWTPEDESPFDG